MGVVNTKYINICRKIILLLSTCGLAYVVSFIMLLGTNALESYASVLLLVFFILVFSSSKTFFWVILFPLVLLHAIYIPLGLMYGPLHYSFWIAGAAADISELSEFFQLIDKSSISYSILLITLTIINRHLIVKCKIAYYKSYTFMSLGILYSVLVFLPNSIFQQILTSMQELKEEYRKIELLRENNDWKNVSRRNFTEQYDTYVLVIGESARKDYHHSYGYPIENTPFMSQSHGIIVSGLTSGGSASVSSLRLMLTLAETIDWSARYSLNLIDLAKSSGLTTYWLSNSGYLGEHDTPVTAIAKSSDVVNFLKTGDYSSKNTSDFELLLKLKKILDIKQQKPKFIILHLYGSHPDACQRIEDYHLITTVKHSYYANMNCYISSIHKTDKLLENVYELLKEQWVSRNNSFSMVYFSDHGLVHREINDELRLNNNVLSKYHYEIPLFKISSDDVDRQECQSFKSGLNFTNGIANWMGITAAQLDPNYSLFDCKDDPSDFGLSEKLVNGIDDPAIDITGK